jgi:4-diphosphocytidyl-2-C-methyl-D-erythritol kinase
VFRAFDDACREADVWPDDPELRDDSALMQALRAGDPAELGAALHNDLQGPSLELAPHLRLPLEVARDAGALGVMVSGSGPTVAALARSRQHALAIAAAWTAGGCADAVLTAVGPVAGARIV